MYQIILFTVKTQAYCLDFWGGVMLIGNPSSNHIPVNVCTRIRSLDDYLSSSKVQHSAGENSQRSNFQELVPPPAVAPIQVYIFMCLISQLNCNHRNAKIDFENIILSWSTLLRVSDQVISTSSLRSRDGHIRHFEQKKPSKYKLESDIGEFR